MENNNITPKIVGAIAEGMFARYGMERPINREIFGKMILGLWYARKKNGVVETEIQFLRQTIEGCRDYDFFDHAIMALYQQMYLSELGLA